MQRCRGLVVSCLLAICSAVLMGRPLRISPEIWKESPATYTLEIANYRGESLLIRKRLQVETVIESKREAVRVLFRPSGRTIVEAQRPEWLQADPLEVLVDAYLATYPVILTFHDDQSVTLNLDRNLQQAERFFKKYRSQATADSPLQRVPPEGFKAMVHMQSQMLMGLFINQLVFGSEFEEGKSTYRYDPAGPIPEAEFDLVATLYGWLLLGEASMRDGQGKVVSRNTYRFEFTPMAETMTTMRMEVNMLETQLRNVFLLTK